MYFNIEILPRSYSPGDELTTAPGLHVDHERETNQ